MTPIERLSSGREEQTLRRMEEILRSAVDFEPETEATYNFAAAAMARRRFRARALWMAVTGCACSALLVWCATRHKDLPVPVFPVPTSAGPALVLSQPGKDSDEAETSTHTLKQVSEPVAARLGLTQARPRQSAARLVRDDRDEDQAVPKAKWETETVDRYATGLLEPTYVEERNPDGSRTYKPAVRTIPLESGERPATEASGDMGVVSLVNYGGERTK